MNRSRRRSLLRDDRGVSAVEFALIVPIVLILLIGMVYINEALTVHRKLRQVTFAAADLIAQQDAVTRQNVELTLAAPTRASTSSVHRARQTRSAVAKATCA